MGEMVFKNARIILADRVIEGSLKIHGRIITQIDEGPCRVSGAIDCQGNFICPGLIELHTDNVERHLSPRPNSIWPATSAILNHDREIIGAGITTVFNALYVGNTRFSGRSHDHMVDACNAVATAKSAGNLKADHFLHLRCEVSESELLSDLTSLLTNSLSQLVYIMDHTPGQRQFVSLDAFKTYYQGKYNMSDAVFSSFVDEQVKAQKKYSATNRRLVVKQANDLGIRLASHDDATLAHVEEAVADRVSIAEFPTTLEAARASHNSGLAVLMGGPNIVRGKSHNGNASARGFAKAGYLDIISSDYVPASLLHACLTLENSVDTISMPEAISMVTKTPAQHVGLTDRGEISPGKLADLVVFTRREDVPVISQVWREGVRVA